MPHDPEFNPNQGGFPPELAGRNDEMADITEALNDLEEGFGPSSNIALIGPEGFGKTALLRWAEAEVRRRYGNVACEYLDPDCFNSRQDLVAALSGPSVLSKLAGKAVSTSANRLKSGADLTHKWGSIRSLRSVLEKRCSKKGLAILIDDAHTLDRYPSVARGFFNEAQIVSGRDQPLLLVLAGTPNIWSRLRKIEVTYLDRLNKIGVWLLDDEAARSALRIPFERSGYCIEAGTLEKAANAAQRHPLFLQLVGRELHRAANAEPGKLGRGNQIGAATLEKALKEFHICKNNYYSELYQELQDGGTLSPAEAVARLFSSREKELIPTAAFGIAVERSVDAKLEELARSRGAVEPAAWVETELRQIGLVWSRFGHERMCEPGIPGFMGYIVKKGLNV